MGLTRNHSAKWVFLLFLPFIILLLSSSSVFGQWTSITPPAVSGYWTLSGVHFTSANEGWVAGWDSDNHKGVLLHYQNGTWVSVSPPDVSGSWSLSGVHFTMADDGWAVGYDDEKLKGILLHYQNGIWTSVTPPEVSGYWSLSGVHFTSADEGWAVGWDGENYRGVLLHYQNGIWTSVTPPDVSLNWYVASVHFTSPIEGWAVGMDSATGQQYKGVLLRYENGTWTSVTPPNVSLKWDLAAVHFTSANEGWAVGSSYVDYNNGGVLLHYQDGIWTSVTPPFIMGPYWRLHGIHFASATEGWVVGWDYGNYRSALIRYRNGTWVSVTPPTVTNDWDLVGVYFTSPTEGWAVGFDQYNYKGVLFHYLSLWPNKGSIGTQITIIDSGFGSEKGKVLIGNASTKIISWSDSLITAEIAKALPLGPHAVVVKPKEPKRAAPIVYNGAFTMLPPETISIDPVSGTEGAEITVSGNYFGSKKGKVYLVNPSSGKKKNCKIITWSMDSVIGESHIHFVVPKKMPLGTYNITVTNKVGSHTLANGFTIP